MKFFISLLLMSFTAYSCSKKSNGVELVTPTNLVFSALVSTDSSGNVSFTASADNAAGYEFDYGNGTAKVTLATGDIVYKYPSSGTYTATVTAKSNTGGSASKSTTITVNVIRALVWSEEFDYTGLPDAKKWGYDIGGNGWGNNEAQYYTDRIDNANVSNGTLKITLKKESFSGNTFTSARLISKNKFSFKYGKIEVSAKLPSGVGTWPAIWMLGSNIDAVNWPACGEIDIMEHLGRDLNRIYGTLHYPGRSGANADGNSVVINGATTAFHKYSAEWSESTIKIYVDDILNHSVGNNNRLPFNQNFFIILNIAMGGDFGGPAIDPAFTVGNMEIDYIRVYQ